MEVGIPWAGSSIWLVAKILYLIALLIYSIFAGVVVRQVGLMIHTLEVGFELPIKLIAWGHLIFAVGIFLLAIIIL